MDNLHVFEAGKGINATKINENFASLKDKANANETELTQIGNTALKRDGTNLTQEIVNDFNSNEVEILSGSGDIRLQDNGKDKFLTLTGNGKIVLPPVPQDAYSHTICMVVNGSQYKLDLGTTKHLVSNTEINKMQPYSVMYVYNKIDSSWYYNLTQ